MLNIYNIQELLLTSQKKNKKTNSETDKIRNRQFENVTHRFILLNYPISESWKKPTEMWRREHLCSVIQIL